MTETTETAEAIRANLDALSHALHEVRVDYRNLLLARRRAWNDGREFSAADVQKLIERAQARPATRAPADA